MKTRREGHGGCHWQAASGEKMQKYDKSLKWKHVGREEEQVRACPPQVFVGQYGSPRLHCHLAAAAVHGPGADVHSAQIKNDDKSCREAFRGIPSGYS